MKNCYSMLSVLPDCITIVIFAGKSSKKWISELKMKCDISAPLAASHVIAICLSNPAFGTEVTHLLNQWGSVFKLVEGKHYFWSCVWITGINSYHSHYVNY